MKERILAFLKAENKSSAQFAEEIGVQPSGISHIISGRNNPSLDFVLKMLERYPYISSGWLLFGKGSMYNEPSLASLFDENDGTESEKPQGNGVKPIKKSDETVVKPIISEGSSDDLQKPHISGVKKIIWFYEDNSFEEFYPRIS